MSTTEKDILTFTNASRCLSHIFHVRPLVILESAQNLFLLFSDRLEHISNYLVLVRLYTLRQLLISFFFFKKWQCICEHFKTGFQLMHVPNRLYSKCIFEFLKLSIFFALYLLSTFILTSQCILYRNSHVYVVFVDW